MTMSRRPITRPPRVQERRSRLATVLVLLAVLVVGSAVTAVLFVPTSLEEFAAYAATVLAVEGTGWAIHALWERMTRKRRRDRLSG
jgi:hypothetical protein